MAVHWQSLLGRSWSAVPHPPQSFTCGELVRFIYASSFGLSIPPIRANACSLKECIRDIEDTDAYGFYPFAGDVRAFDVVYFIRGKLRSHVGLAVSTQDGLGILHCQQGCGVVLETLASLQATGFRHWQWKRHRDMPMQEAICPQ